MLGPLAWKVNGLESKHRSSSMWTLVDLENPAPSASDSKAQLFVHALH